MSSGFSGDNLPGVRASIFSEEKQVFFHGPNGEAQQVVVQGAQINSAVVDAGNTPTTTLRAGNVMAKKTSDGQQYLYSANANDGTQFVSGVLGKCTNMLEAGVAVNKWGLLLQKALIHVADLLGYDLAALGVLQRMGCVLDKDTAGSVGAQFLYQARGVQFHAADYTVTTADNGKCLRATAAVNYTLPALSAAMVGFAVQVQQVTNTNLVVTAAADTIAYDDTAGGKATTLTWGTANQKMGAGAILRATYLDTAGTLGWVVEQPQRTVVAA